MPSSFNGGRDRDWGFEASAGRYSDTEVVHKFGRNAAVGSTFVPVAIGGIYRTPQVAGATALRIKAGGHADDIANGDGAREVTLVGLDETGAEVTETLATAGASASAATSATFIRLYRAYVSKSGTYASQSAGAHVADITIENVAGGTNWATIDSTNFPKAQSEIAVYTVPAGKKAFLEHITVFSDSSKITDVLLFQRTGALQTAPPYDAMRLVLTFTTTGGNGIVSVSSEPAPIGPFAAGTDVGFMAKVNTGTSQVSVDFEVVLVDA